MDGGTVVGAITKQWVGCGTECFTDADTFSVTCMLFTLLFKLYVIKPNNINTLPWLFHLKNDIK